MRAAEQWSVIEERLPHDWDEAELSFAVEDAAAVSAAAVVLAPLGPGRAGSELRFRVGRRGGGTEMLRNLLGRLDRKRLWGTLAVVRAESAVSAEAGPTRTTLVEGWDAEIASLPPGWRDLLCELELDSTDYLARAALLGAPLNPTRVREAIALRFRAGSAGAGYGAAEVMVRRCLERMDAEGITGRITVLHSLSDTANEATQGPVWRIAGRSV